MRIGIAGPLSLDVLKPHLLAACELPRAYPFATTGLLACELLRSGYEVTCYAASPEITTPYYTSHGPLTVCVSPSRPRHRAKTLFREEVRSLREAFSRHPCDLIHAHWTYEFAVAALGSGLPTLITAHDAAGAILRQFRDAYRAVRWGMNAYTVRRATHLSAVSPYVRETLPSSARKKTVVIPNFVPDLASRRSEPARDAYIISVSNGFSELKNVKNALHAFAKAAPKLKNVKFLLVGHGYEPGGPSYRFCEAAGYLENLEFAGPVSHERVIDLVSKAILLLHPSYEEACSMAVLEAMALGTPAIGGIRSGGIPYMIEHEKTGLLCDVSDPAAISDALCHLVGDRALRKRLGSAATETVFEKYSAPVVVGQYVKEYHRVLENRQAADEPQVAFPDRESLVSSRPWHG